MRHITVHLWLILLLALATGCGPAPEGPSSQEMIDAANQLDEAFVDAFNRGDAEALANLYWDNPGVVNFPPDALDARGLDAIRAGTSAMFAGMEGATIELPEAHQMVAGDVVIGWGLFTMTVPAPGGGTEQFSGRYTDVKAERDGKWVYILDHASVPLPPAE